MSFADTLAQLVNDFVYDLIDAIMGIVNAMVDVLASLFDSASST